MSLLFAQSLSKSYFDDPVLYDVTFRLSRGDRLGLIGENGVGKTTLFKILNKELSPDSGKVVIASGCVMGYLRQSADDIFSGEEDILKSSELISIENKMRNTEHAMAAIEDHLSSEYKVLAEKYSHLSARFDAMDGYAYERNMMEILTGLELTRRAFDTPMKNLSGGEKIRVALARLLLKRPDILLLDEPTNHLDISAMEWLEDTLISFKGAMIIISHDRYFLDRVCNKTARLRKGNISVISGNYSTFIQQDEIETDFIHKEKKRLENEIKRQTQIKQTMFSHRNMSGYHMKEKALDKLSSELSQIRERMDTGSGAKMKFSLLDDNDIRNKKSVILSVKDLGKSFGDSKIFEGISFDVTAGDKLFIVGPNGCGKSTLLSILLGGITEFEGEVKLSRHRTYAYMGQNISFPNERLTILDHIRQKLDIPDGPAKEFLADYGFYDTDIYKKLSVLSGGERVRLYLACILSERPEIIFLDEPTNHLDIPSREILEEALNSFGGAVIAVSHDRYFIHKCAGRILGFSNGTASGYDSYDIYRTSAKKEKEDSPSPAKESRDPRKQIRLNKAQERKEKAALKENIKEAEERLMLLEGKKEEMESGFGPDTLPETYSEYSALLKKIDELYSEYERDLSYLEEI